MEINPSSNALERTRPSYNAHWNLQDLKLEQQATRIEQMGVAIQAKVDEKEARNISPIASAFSKAI